MMNTKHTKTAIACLIAGMLLATITPILAIKRHMPDSMMGFMVGIGIGLALVAVVKLVKLRKLNGPVQ